MKYYVQRYLSLFLKNELLLKKDLLCVERITYGLYRLLFLYSNCKGFKQIDDIEHFLNNSDMRCVFVKGIPQDFIIYRHVYNKMLLDEIKEFYIVIDFYEK